VGSCPHAEEVGPRSVEFEPRHQGTSGRQNVRFPPLGDVPAKTHRLLDSSLGLSFNPLQAPFLQLLGREWLFGLLGSMCTTIMKRLGLKMADRTWDIPLLTPDLCGAIRLYGLSRPGLWPLDQSIIEAKRVQLGNRFLGLLESSVKKQVADVF